MKILIIMLLFSATSYGQTIDKLVQNAATAVADAKIAELAKSIDSILIVKATRTGSFVLDTIKIPNNQVRIFQITITGKYKTNMASGAKFIAASNDNGIYSIKRLTDDWSFTGITGHIWEVVVLSNQLIVRMKANASTPYLVEWEYKRYNL